MGLLDLIYAKNRPPAVSAADLDAKMKALADQASRKVAELEKAERDRRSVTPPRTSAKSAKNQN
jgi:hypothetical protein